MNIHRFILPATIAATVHVALLWFLPEESYVRVTSVRVGIGCTLTAAPEEPIVLPPEDSAPDAAPVKSLAGGPVPPDLSEVTVFSDKAEFTMPVEERVSIRTDTPLKEVSKLRGDGTEGIGGPGFNPPTVFRPGDLDRTPNAKVQISPEYPYEMSKSGTSGSVMVEFDVDKSGNVVRAVVVSYSHREFTEPALRAVRKWRFEPGRREGKAVPFRMTVPIEFGIEK